MPDGDNGGVAGIASECTTATPGSPPDIPTGHNQSLQNQCVTCHPNAADHMADVINVRAKVSFTLEACRSATPRTTAVTCTMTGPRPVTSEGSVKTSKYDEFPNYKYLMGGHGFTIEYTEKRTHAYMLKDHIDTHRKQTTTCLQCKSTPVAYYWNELTRGAVQFEKSMAFADAVQKIHDQWPETMDYGAGCTHCHDPHSGDFRLIRKGVIEAILARGTDPYSPSLNVIPASEARLRRC